MAQALGPAPAEGGGEHFGHLLELGQAEPGCCEIRRRLRAHQWGRRFGFEQQGAGEQLAGLRGNTVPRALNKTAELSAFLRGATLAVQVRRQGERLWKGGDGAGQLLDGGLNDNLTVDSPGTGGIDLAARVHEYGLVRLNGDVPSRSISGSGDDVAILNHDILRIDVDFAAGGFIASAHRGGQRAVLQHYGIGRGELDVAA